MKRIWPLLVVFVLPPLGGRIGPSGTGVPPNVGGVPIGGGIGSAFFVSCSLGSGGAGTQLSPFGSLAQAQTAMRSSNIKTAIVSGTCNLSANWNFTSADTGETWEAACGQITAINGQMTTVNQPNVTTECAGIAATSNGYYIYVNGANNLSFYGFTFENLATQANSWGNGGLIIENSTGDTIRWNTFSNVAMAAISLYRASGDTGGNDRAVIDSNTVNGVNDGYPTNYNMSLTSGTDGLCFSPGAVIFNGPINVGAGNNVQVTHNLIENTQGGGVQFQGNNETIDSNILINTNQECYDCGGFYTYNETGVTYTGNVLTNNNVQLANTTYQNESLASPIYFDGGGTSDITATGNAVCATAAPGGNGNSGLWLMANTGGNNIVVENNIVGVSYAPLIAYYDASGTGNLLEHNIFYSTGVFPTYIVQIGGGTACPTDSNNLYWSATGATIPTGQCADSSPIYSNPGFSNISTCNFAMSNPPSGFTALTTNRGPVANTFCPGGY